MCFIPKLKIKTKHKKAALQIIDFILFFLKSLISKQINIIKIDGIKKIINTQPKKLGE